MGPVETTNQGENQGGGKWILIGGLAVVVILIASFGFFFFSKVKSPSSNIAQQTTPTPVTTSIPSPTPKDIVYRFPTTTGILPSPTLALIVTITPTKAVSTTKTPTLTKMPSPTITTKPKIPTASPTTKLVIGGPASPSQGGPEATNPAATSTVSPTKAESASQAAVIVPKMPVAGSISQTLYLVFLAISAVAIGLIL